MKSTYTDKCTRHAFLREGGGDDDMFISSVGGTLDLCDGGHGSE